MRSIFLAGLMSCVAMSAEGMSGGGSCPGVMTLAGALSSLDPADGNDWTEGGLPSMGRLKVLTGNEKLTRAEVSEAFPGFARDTAHAGIQKNEPPTEPDGSASAFHEEGRPTGELVAAMAEMTAADRLGLVDVPNDRPEGPTPERVAQAVPDAVMLLEALCIVAGSERYSRNSSLQTLIRGYQVSQREIKDVQGRLDARAAAREAQRAGDTSNG